MYIQRRSEFPCSLSLSLSLHFELFICLVRSGTMPPNYVRTSRGIFWSLEERAYYIHLWHGKSVGRSLETRELHHYFQEAIRLQQRLSALPLAPLAPCAHHRLRARKYVARRPLTRSSIRLRIILAAISLFLPLPSALLLSLPIWSSVLSVRMIYNGYRSAPFLYTPIHDFFSLFLSLGWYSTRSYRDAKKVRRINRNVCVCVYVCVCGGGGCIRARAIHFSCSV